MSQQQLNDSDRPSNGDAGSGDAGHGAVENGVPANGASDLASIENGVSVSSGNGSNSGSAVAIPFDHESSQFAGISTTTWIKVGVIVFLFACLFWPNLRRLWDKTNPFYGEANWGHAIVVPIVGLYYLYVNRERLLTPAPLQYETSPADGLVVWSMLALMMAFPLLLLKELVPGAFKIASLSVVGLAIAGLVVLLMPAQQAMARRARESSARWFGGFVLIFGIALFGYGIYPGQNDFVKDFGMVVTLGGVVLALTSWAVMRTAWFPIAFLVCAIPWPGLMYSRIAGPLQQMAARAAVWTLEMTGVESTAGGTKIMIQGHGGMIRTLNVAEACAGLRSLMTFVSVGAAVSFLSGRPLWQKITVTLSAIPIAIFCNVMRVSGQGLLDHYVSQQLSENFAHQFVGMIMLIPAFLLILLVGWVLDQIFLEEVDRRGPMPQTKVIRRTQVATAVAVLPPRRSLGPRGAIPATTFRGQPVPLASGAAHASMTASRPTPVKPASVKSGNGAAGATKSKTAAGTPLGNSSGGYAVTPPPTIRLASRPAPIRKPPAAPPASAPVAPPVAGATPPKPEAL